MTPPPSYIERFPGNQPWQSVEEQMPLCYSDTQILFEDGKTQGAYWTGKYWWNFYGPHFPIAWRFMPGTHHW